MSITCTAMVLYAPLNLTQEVLPVCREFQEEVEERARREISHSRDSAGSVSTGGAAYASPTSMTMQGGRASSNGAPPASRQAVIATPPDLQVALRSSASSLRTFCHPQGC